MPFSRCTLQGLLSHKYWWPMTHSLPRHGRFLYLTETLKFSQYCGLQGHPKWEVNFRDFVNIPIFGQNSFFQIRFFGHQMCLKAHLGQFWKHLKHRSSMKSIFNHKFKRFSPNFAKIPTFFFNFDQILSISLILSSHFGWPCRPHCWLYLRVSVRYKNRPCLGRKWVMGQHHLWS